eukprot:12023967-Ditylum_brightwellii.AAC.1
MPPPPNQNTTISQCEKGKREDPTKEKEKRVSMPWHGSKGHADVGGANTTAKESTSHQKTNRALTDAAKAAENIAAATS